ncbi:MAG: enoyl-CoA hydratase/isomerase family protein [Bacteroidota bacterium]
MGEQSVVVTSEGQVAIVRLNEPRTMNAMSAGVREGLTREIPRLLDDPGVRCLVITGTDGAFCAGGDIRNMDDRRPTDTRARMHRHYKGWAGRLLKAEKPVVMAVNGAAAGAGVSLALMGDLIIASRTAYFTTAFARLGVVPDLGLIATLPRAIGMARAKDMLLTSRKVPAEEAWQMGLVARLAEPSELMSNAIEAAQALAAGPTVTLGLIKRLLQRAYEGSFDEYLEVEAFAQAVAMSTQDFEEGVAAFKEKRRPKFQGR